MDDHKNFAYSTVATAPSPATSGTSLVVAAGEGAGFPAVPFNAVIWPAGAQPLASNAEIVRVTARSTDTLTITRTQEGTSARTVVVGDQICAAVTDLTLTDAEQASWRVLSQTAHGFAVGDVVRHNGTSYVKAQADSAANAEAVGVVSQVHDANTFALTTHGYVSGLSGLTAGSVYFLSPSSAGALTATEPSTAGQVSKPLLIAVSTTAGYFFNLRGVVIRALAEMIVKVTEDDVVVVTGNGQMQVVIPASLNGANLVSAHAFLSTVSSSGTVTVQIRNATQAADMLSTAITIDASEFTSYSAATPPVVDTGNDDVATGDLIAVDVDGAGTGAKGLGVILRFST